ncbi:hypothetical protein OIU78_025016 [Salix suchowensis]|nr:hypothetical protein OIU78_025016 [Salix suchowensis]
MALKDNLIETCGNQLEAIARLQKWEHGDDSFSTAAYDFFRAHGSKVSWEKVVCESWSMTKFNFILWPWSAAHLQATLVLSWLSSPVSCFPLHCLDRRLRLIVRVRVLPLFLEPYPLRVEASLPPAGKPPFWACWAVMWVDFWVS